MPVSSPATSPVAPMNAPMNASGPGMQPGWYGPYPHLPLLMRLWWLPALTVAIAAALIIANGIALLDAGFFAYWSTLLPWISALGSFSFILGIVLGLVLFGSIVMMFMKYRIIAAFIILPTAIISLFIGGGFFLGAILAVLVGILLLTKHG